MLNPRLSKIYAAIIIVIVAAAVKVAAKNILQPVLEGPGEGRLAAVVTSIFGALEQVGITPAIVNGAFLAGPIIITAPARMSIGFGGIGY